MNNKFNLDKDLIIIDLETTGVSPATSSMIQLGACVFTRKGQVGDCFNIYVKPYKPEWTLQSEQIHRISQLFLHKNGVSVSEALERFINWTEIASEKFYIAQWSCGFDTNILKSAFEFSKIEYPFSYRSYDIASIVRFHLALQGKKPEGLSRTAKTLKIDMTGFKAHNAEHDAKITALCLEKVVNEFQ